MFLIKVLLILCIVITVYVNLFITAPSSVPEQHSRNVLRTFIPEPKWEPPRNVERFKECDIPCFYDRSIPLVGRKTVFDEKGRSSTFMHTMEGPKHYPRSRTKGNYDGLSTVSMKSDVPLPYFSWAEYNIKTPAIDFNSSIKGGVFIARNCRSLNDREGLIRELQKYMRLDSVSSCLNNAPWPSDVPRQDKGTVMRRYLFYFALENECSEDYMTEKLWGALGSGTLPIYYGAPNVLEYVPENSIVDVNLFVGSDGKINYKELGEYLTMLSQDEEKYKEYHKWRLMDGYPEKFTSTYDFTHTHNLCRSCRWNLARHEPEKYIFDHKTQELIII